VSQLSQKQIDQIASKVLQKLQAPAVQKNISAQKMDVLGTRALDAGVFADIDTATDAAKKAQMELMELSLKLRDRIISSIRSKMFEHAEDLAQRAIEETG